MPAKRKIKINTHFFGGKHKCALTVWITWKGLRKNVKIIHILKKAGYKIGLPFGTAQTCLIFSIFILCVIIIRKRRKLPMDKQRIEELRKHYIKNPPEGMDASDIRDMSDDDLLDMDYFLHEDDDLDDDFGTEGFYIF